MTIGLDTLQGNFALPAFNGRAWGQVFLAQDTLIQSITVWRTNAQGINVTPMHLFITEVDSLGRPDLGSVILDGPSIVITTPADTSRLDRVRFVFDPPLDLSHKGNFWFALKEDVCASAFTLLADSSDSYPDGRAWRTEPANNSCLGVGCCADDFGGRFDLIFEVEFCHLDTPIQTEPGSWGHLKAQYR